MCLRRTGGRVISWRCVGCRRRGWERSLDRLGNYLAEHPQETAERVDGRRDAVALDTRDRRLRGVCALREFLLSDVVALADAADEFAGRGVSVVRHDTRFRRKGVVSFHLLRHFAQ